MTDRALTVDLLRNAALSADPIVRARAENDLRLLEGQRGFFLVLLGIANDRPTTQQRAAAHKDLLLQAAHTRFLALSCLRRLVPIHWPVKAGGVICDDDERQRIRTEVVCCLEEHDEQVAEQACLLFACIATLDFPREWSALDVLKNAIETDYPDSPQVRGRALQSLLLMTRYLLPDPRSMPDVNGVRKKGLRQTAPPTTDEQRATFRSMCPLLLSFVQSLADASLSHIYTQFLVTVSPHCDEETRLSFQVFHQELIRVATSPTSFAAHIPLASPIAPSECYGVKVSHPSTTPLLDDNGPPHDTNDLPDEVERALAAAVPIVLYASLAVRIGSHILRFGRLMDSKDESERQAAESFLSSSLTHLDLLDWSSRRLPSSDLSGPLCRHIIRILSLAARLSMESGESFSPYAPSFTNRAIRLIITYGRKGRDILSNNPVFEKFIVRSLLLLRAFLESHLFKIVEAPFAYSVFNTRHPKERPSNDPLLTVVELFDILVINFIQITSRERDDWDASPEIVIIEDEKRSWESHLKPCAEVVLASLVPAFKERLGPRLVALFVLLSSHPDGLTALPLVRSAVEANQDVLNVYPRTNLVRESVFNAISLSSDECCDILPFRALIEPTAHDLGLTDPAQLQHPVHSQQPPPPSHTHTTLSNPHIYNPRLRFLRRRMATLIEGWSRHVQSQDEARLACRVLMILLDDPHDVVVRMSAAVALKVMLEEMDMEISFFREYLLPCIHRVLRLVDQLEEGDSHLELIVVIDMIMVRVGPADVIPCGAGIVHAITGLWSADSNPIRKGMILRTLKQFVVIHGDIGVINYYPTLLPLISLAVRRDGTVEANHIMTDALDLWLCILTRAPNVTDAPLLDLFSSACRLLETRSDVALAAESDDEAVKQRKLACKILECFVLRGGADVCMQPCHARPLLASLKRIVYLMCPSSGGGGCGPLSPWLNPCEDKAKTVTRTLEIAELYVCAHMNTGTPATALATVDGMGNVVPGGGGGRDTQDAKKLPQDFKSLLIVLILLLFRATGLPEPSASTSSSSAHVPSTKRQQQQQQQQQQRNNNNNNNSSGNNDNNNINIINAHAHDHTINAILEFASSSLGIPVGTDGVGTCGGARVPLVVPASLSASNQPNLLCLLGVTSIISRVLLADADQFLGLLPATAVVPLIDVWLSVLRSASESIHHVNYFERYHWLPLMHRSALGLIVMMPLPSPDVRDRLPTILRVCMLALGAERRYAWITPFPTRRSAWKTKTKRCVRKQELTNNDTANNTQIMSSMAAQIRAHKLRCGPANMSNFDYGSDDALIRDLEKLSTTVSVSSLSSAPPPQAATFTFSPSAVTVVPQP
eukprot:TRINITY_DN2065_c0_g1_i1.p1 TRINITY_DN2065_c0_g1~~TRINITY_DN2065_c0_g1_i1.p1  ORF type:complete len:1339 (+),score=259.88 TRINITY_DN2065_c0_g1_i1:544-4560(+)